MSSKKNVLLIGGDGIGPEVTAQSRNVLQHIGELFGHSFYFEEALMGHVAIQATGNPLPDETLEKAKGTDAILFGAIGHPSYDENPHLKVRPEQGLLRIRKELGLFANIRPIQVFDELLDASPLKKDIVAGADIMFFRELTGDVYFGEKKRSENRKVASDLMIYTEEEVERIARMAFQAASLRLKKVCSVDKANVLESSRLWREVVQRVGMDYPDISLSHMFVDNAAMQLIANPRQFDVILTSNLFGDILTDEASQITGSLGMLPSASIGGKVGLFEPIHGSAPLIAGKDIANPIASILSASLLLETMGMKKEADAIVNGVKTTLAQGYRTADLMPSNLDKLLGTNAMGKKIVENIIK